MTEISLHFPCRTKIEQFWQNVFGHVNNFSQLFQTRKPFSRSLSLKKTKIRKSHIRFSKKTKIQKDMPLITRTVRSTPSELWKGFNSSFLMKKYQNTKNPRKIFRFSKNVDQYGFARKIWAHNSVWAWRTVALKLDIS